MSKQSDRRDLSLVRESGSTTRVLDLAYIHETHGHTPEHQQRPLFRNPMLNTSIIMKHALRAHERSLFNRARVTATKIVFPFSNKDLRLGGSNLFVGEPDFDRTLRHNLAYNSPIDFEQDMDLLRLLDSLPSFDPFLMRERMRQAGLEPARCYFDVTDADAGRMRAFVSGQIAELVQLAFGGVASAPPALSSRLAEKLMTDETAESLAPLRATLRLTGDEYREGVFAWKGFLYYKWVLGELSPRLAELARSIIAARVVNASRDDLMSINSSRQRIVKILGRTTHRVQQALADYDTAFRALSQGRPTAFRDFLLSAPAMFLVIGEAVGVIKHIDSFWRFRFPAGRIPMMDTDEAFEVFQEFELTLSGIEAAQNEDVFTAHAKL
ncbi:MAG: hypothetical protein NW200_12005 [Hyphomonadaceae bacterium]|nr:hypothetical protein [Hyphomonadaceae bacterium]